MARNQPTAWGLYDMHGNVAEMCPDAIRPYGSDVSDPLGVPAAAARRARRRLVQLRPHLSFGSTGLGLGFRGLQDGADSGGRRFPVTPPNKENGRHVVPFRDNRIAVCRNGRCAGFGARRSLVPVRGRAHVHIHVRHGGHRRRADGVRLQPELVHGRRTVGLRVAGLPGRYRRRCRVPVPRHQRTGHARPRYHDL
ncbi:MAG: hypothetical protein IPH86_07480 [bacterium]|nr:hypothetical protein [bacterium]